MFKVIHPNRWFFWTIAVVVIVTITLWWAIQQYSLELDSQSAIDESANNTKISVVRPSPIDYNPVTTKLATLYGNPNESDPGRYPRYGFSEDGRKFYYNAYNTLTGKEHVTVNGIPGKDYDSVEPNSIGFYGDRIVYHAYDKEKELFVVDGKELEAHGYISALPGPYFSKDWNDYAYISLQGEKESFVVNGKESPAYDSISNIDFKDAQHYKFVGNRGSSQVVVTSGNEGQASTTLQVSETPWEDPCANDGRVTKWIPYTSSSVYVCAKNYNTLTEDNYIVINGQKSKVYSRIYNVAQSADGKQIAYSGNDNSTGNWIVVLNGNEVATYHLGDGNTASISEMGFTPDNKLMYEIFRYKNKTEKDSLFIGGKEYKTDHIWWPLIFSPDGKHYGYLATTNAPEESYVVIDGVEQKRYEGDVSTVKSLTFSPDGKSYAYLASVKESKSIYSRYHMTVVINGVEGTNYDDILYGPIFTSDSKSIMFGALKGNDIWWIVEPVEKQ